MRPLRVCGEQDKHLHFLLLLLLLSVNQLCSTPPQHPATQPRHSTPSPAFILPQCTPPARLSALYLVDSIIKNVKEPYTSMFCKRLDQVRVRHRSFQVCLCLVWLVSSHLTAAGCEDAFALLRLGMLSPTFCFSLLYTINTNTRCRCLARCGTPHQLPTARP